MRQPVYSKDMVEALNLCMTSEAAVGQTFVIAGPKATRSRDLLRVLASAARCAQPKSSMPPWLAGPLVGVLGSVFGLMKSEPPVSRTTLEFFQINNAFDTSKAKDTLGFEPKFSFRDGLKDCQAELGSR